MNKQEYDDMVKAMLQDAEGGSSKFWRPGSKKEGKFPIRILPPMRKNGEKVFYFTHKTHFIGGIPFECLNQTVTDKNGDLHQAEACPVCAFASKLYNSSERDSDEWKLAGQIRARKRYVSRIVVRGKEDETLPEFYEYGTRIWEKLFNILTESDFGNILDPKDGRDFIIHKVGTGRTSNYDSSIPSADRAPIFTEKEDLVKVLSNATDMKYSDLIEFRSAEDMNSALTSFLKGDVEEEKGPVVREAQPKPKAKVSRQEDIQEDYGFEEEPELNEDEIDSILDEFIS